MSVLLRSLVLLTASAGLLAAQGNPPVRIAVSVYAFDYAPDHDTVYAQTGPESFEEIMLSKANIVGPVPAFAANGTLQLHGAPVTAADGTVTHPVVATTRVPAEMRRALVVLFPNPAGAATPYRSLVFEHNERDFPFGTYRIINLAPTPIRGAVGSQVVNARPGEITNLELRGQPGSIAPVRFEYFDDGNWNLLTETRCAIRNDRRWLMCVYQDPANGRYHIRTIPDRTEPGDAVIRN